MRVQEGCGLEVRLREREVMMKQRWMKNVEQEEGKKKTYKKKRKAQNRKKQPNCKNWRKKQNKKRKHLKILENG